MKPTLAHILVAASLAFACVRSSAVSPALAGQHTVLSLAGVWQFKADPQKVGVSERWFAQELPKKIRLPSSMVENGYGDDVTVDTQWTGQIVDRSWFTQPQYEPYRKAGAIKVPFWLTPDRHYVGSAWYQKTVTIPDSWRGARVTLSLERCHWETQLWVDDVAAGMCNSLSVPHVYDLGARLSPGRHRLTLRVDNTVKINVGENAHSVSDHTQGNWNGIVGEIKLTAGSPVWIDDLQVYPDVARKLVRIKARVGNALGTTGQGRVSFRVRTAGEKAAGAAGAHSVAFELQPAGATLEAEYPMGAGVALWDEFFPAMYQLTGELAFGGPGAPMRDVKTVTFGMRDLGREGTQFTVNGRKIFLRGTLECCIFPRTGYPPTDREFWKRIIRVCKAHGLNHIRFHSWCPPEAAFAAADELGFYYHVECAAWANVDDKPLGEFIYAESDRILRQYGNHPSFCLLAYGNEPGGTNQARFLGDLVKSWKAKDPRRKYTSAAGWPSLPENDYHSTPAPRVQAWGGGLNSRINARPPETTTDYADFIGRYEVPVVSHEIGQWCVYPNFREIPKYKGPLKAKNFEIFRDQLAEHHMADLAERFLLASGKLQALCYKEDIESALRTPGMGGFQLLDLHDFPGQGSALVGVLDPFWESKGYITPSEYRQFSGEVVPLALLEKRVFTDGETFKARVKIAQFGPGTIYEPRPIWSLTEESGRTVASGRFESKPLPVGNDTTLGEVAVPLTGMTWARKLVFTVALEGTPFENHWDTWVYPAQARAGSESKVTIVEELDSRALGILEAGGKVLLIVPPGRAKGDARGRVAVGFSSIFWNTAWTGRQPPHTLGILCNPAHPALADFPTEYHSNWQWWYLLSRSQAMIMDDLPPKLRPIVQLVDDWFTNRRLGLVFEARVSGGKLVVCSIDLKNSLEENPVARQMRGSLLDYMASRKFRPAVELSPEQVLGLMGPASAMRTHGGRVLKTSSAEPGHEGANAIDGDAGTLWHTAYTGQTPGFPHEIQIEFKQSVLWAGLTLLPRQDNNHNGWIKDYAIYVSDKPEDWGQPVAQGAFAEDAHLKTVKFVPPRAGRFVRFVATSGFGSSPWAAIAELDMIPAEGR